MGSYVELYKSKEAQDARTPRAMHRELDKLYFHGRKPWDPCPTKPSFDGLAVPWRRLSFANPPFCQAAKWLNKARAEVAERRVSVVLLPARLNTQYLTELLTSGGCTALHIWMCRVTFLPFEQPLSTTIITLLFGERWEPSSAARRVPCDVWDTGPEGDQRAVLRCARRAFGRVVCAKADRLPGGGVCLVVLDRDFAAGVEMVAAHCRAHRGSTVLVVSLTAFHSAYMRAAQGLIRGIILYRPRLHMGGIETVASSQLVVFGKAVRWQQCKRVPPVYLVDPGVGVLSDA